MIPESFRGGYYPWFLRNRHTLEGDHQVVRDTDDPEKYLQERYNEARAYLDPSDQAKALEDLSPFAKQYCFSFLALLLDCKHPPPQMPRLDLWYDFGFVVCSDEHGKAPSRTTTSGSCLATNLRETIFEAYRWSTYVPETFHSAASPTSGKPGRRVR